MNRDQVLADIHTCIKLVRAADIKECFKTFKLEIEPVKRIIEKYDALEEYLEEDLK